VVVRKLLVERGYGSIVQSSGAPAVPPPAA